MSLPLINVFYIAAAVLFIFGLKQLSSPATAVRGNFLSALGMLIAVLATLMSERILAFEWIAVAAILGALIGALAAQRVAMTAMPEMVALFNGSGGVASLLVGWAALYAAGNTNFTNLSILLSILIGGVTLSGSIMAWGKLSEVMPSRALIWCSAHSGWSTP